MIPDDIQTPWNRRQLLKAAPNPSSKLDYVSTLDGRITAGGSTEAVEVTVRYVPDRMILPAGSFTAYLQSIAAESWSSLEEMGTVIINDAADQLVPRWIEVHLSARQNIEGAIESRAVLLTDRQPRWDNPLLLARLKRY